MWRLQGAKGEACVPYKMEDERGYHDLMTVQSPAFISFPFTVQFFTLSCPSERAAVVRS
jgi:hypothetical protein